MKRGLLKLYVTGDAPVSQRAVATVRHLCEGELVERYELAIVDVLRQPGAAEADKVVATPTLIRVSPPPICRLVGDLSSAERVLSGLDLSSGDDPGE